MARASLFDHWVCPCGGRAWTLDELVELSGPDPEGIGYEQMYRSLIGPFDFYCADEDDVLTDMEALRVRMLYVPVHDDLHPDLLFPEDMELVA